MGHANTSTQKGMVKTSTEVLPGPPSESAQVLSSKKAPVWIRPIITRARQYLGLSDLRVQSRPMNKVRMPSSRRSATTSIGLA